MSATCAVKIIIAGGHEPGLNPKLKGLHAHTLFRLRNRCILLQKVEDAALLSPLRNRRCTNIPSLDGWGSPSQLGGDLSLTLPPLLRPLENQRLGRWGLALRPLPALLSSGSEHLERAVLQSSPLDHASAPHGRRSLSLPRMPLQLRQLQEMPRTIFVAQIGRLSRTRRELKQNSTQTRIRAINGIQNVGGAGGESNPRIKVLQTV